MLSLLLAVSLLPTCEKSLTKECRKRLAPMVEALRETGIGTCVPKQVDLEKVRKEAVPHMKLRNIPAEQATFFAVATLYPCGKEK